MEYLIGIVLATLVAIGLGAGVGFDRDRSFAATVLIVVATYYVLFGVMGGSSRALVLEIIVAGGFVVLAVLGFKKKVWLLPAGIAGHGVFDFFHHLLIENPGVPTWWPGFCMAFDVLFGGWLAWLMVRRSDRSLGEASVPHRGSRDARS
jgi:hypothetical protein